jgi:hypothetical protein
MTRALHLPNQIRISIAKNKENPAPTASNSIEIWIPYLGSTMFIGSALKSVLTSVKCKTAAGIPNNTGINEANASGIEGDLPLDHLATQVPKITKNDTIDNNP